MTRIIFLSYKFLWNLIIILLPYDHKTFEHVMCKNFIWDEVPTMVEIAIFWYQIHITNGLNFMHRKWYTGNQYMVKSAENWMRSNLELLPVINVKSRPRYISALK